MSPRDKMALERLSGMTGEAKAAIVRRLIRQEAQRHGLWPPAIDRHTAQAQIQYQKAQAA